MEVSYTLAAQHYAYFLRFWYRRKARIKPWMRAGLLAMLIALVACFLEVPNLTPWASFVTPVACFIGVLLVLPWLLPLNAAAYARRTPDFLGLHTIRITPECMIGKSGGTETRRQWSVIQEILEDDRILCFFLSPRYGVMLPKDAFDSPASVKRFADAARFYWQHPGQQLPRELAQDDTWPPPPSMLTPS